MSFLTEETVSCPYCGEAIQVLLDPEEAGQDYIEDCQVCCRPIKFVLQVHGEEWHLEVFSENE